MDIVSIIGEGNHRLSIRHG